MSGPRRTTRVNAGKLPHRLDDFVTFEGNQKPTSFPTLPKYKECHSNLSSKVMSQPAIQNNNSGCINSFPRKCSSVQSMKSKSSSFSFRSAASTTRRLQLEAELNARARLNDLEEEEDQIQAALLELQKKKIVREKRLVSLSQELEQSRIVELNESVDGSQILSDDSDEDEVVGKVKPENLQQPIKNCSSWVNSTITSNQVQPPHMISDVPISRQFEEFSKCIANAIITANKDSPKPRDAMDFKNFVARNTGTKDLPNFYGRSEDWPAFIATYERSTRICNFSDEENLVRLQKCLRDKAKEAVNGLLISSRNVPQILRTLHRKFGQPTIIIEKMIQKVRDMPKLKDEKPEQLIDFANAVENLTATIESLKRPHHLFNPILLKELVSKLPFHLCLRWGEIIAPAMEADEEPNIADFAVWLSSISVATSFTNIVSCPSDKNEGKNPKNNRKEIVHATSEPAKKDVKKICIVCQSQSHLIEACKQYLSLDSNERWEIVKSKRVCFCCLQPKHGLKTCSKKKSCGIDDCKRPHHPTLHLSTAKENKPEETQENVMVSRVNHIPEVLLKVIPVKLYGPTGEVSTFAIFDDCASCSLIEESVADRLGLEGYSEPLQIQGTSTLTHVDQNSRRVKLQISDRDATEIFSIKNIRTVQQLDLPVQSVNLENLKRKWKHIRLADIDLQTFVNAKPTILLGADNSDLIVTREVIEGPVQAPMVSRTKLGWVIHGNNAAIRGRVDREFVHLTIDKGTQDLHELVKYFYTFESIGIKYCADQVKSREVVRAEEIMSQTTKRIENRFETGLLWKYDTVQLPESKSLAYRRLKSVERKMDMDQEYARLYSEKLEEYIIKGYATILKPEEFTSPNPKSYFLSHFGVTNPNKPGKLRIVMDAAAKSCGMSLNDHLLTGPDLYNSLPGVLFKFREGEIAVAADIKEMFPQIKIRREDSVAQRFLWRGGDRSREPDVFQMSSMVFGIVSSPAQAQYVKNINAKDFEEDYPEAYDAIVKRHYMDDLLSSYYSEAEAIKVSKDVIHVHSQGGFYICNWISNSQLVLNNLPPEMISKTMTIDLNRNLPDERILGQKWAPFKDLLTFSMNFHKVAPEVRKLERIPTRAEVLSLVMSLFDPLGFLAHFTIQPKLLLQDICRRGVKWDAELPAEFTPRWNSFVSSLSTLEMLAIPRCYSSAIKMASEIQLHVFTDASSQAYATCSYLRIKCYDQVFTAFVMAKSRCAPLKPVSIPRLELQAALIGTRMAKFIVENHSLKISEVHFWTDSTCVLHWIRSDARKFHVYIANRIGEIEESTNATQWHWVPTKENVADEATRNKLEVRPTFPSRWYSGPDFLKLSAENWPTERKKATLPIDPAVLELKKEFVCLTVCNIQKDYLPQVNRFSNWMRLLRATAYCQRLLNRLQKIPVATGELTVNEIDLAEQIWIRHCQAMSFPEEVHCLKSNKEICRTSKILSLTPFLDNDGIMRVKSRTANSPEQIETAKYPVILNPTDPFTKLLVDWFHRRFNHHGQEKLVNELRQKYWILNIRAAARSSWNRCQYCKNIRARPSIPEMADLPEMRVTRHTRAFTHTGLDCFGPMAVKVGRRTEKRYGLILTCLSTRAIHVELLDSMNTDSAILALRRFFSLRGQPVCLYSDNGSNFRGADNELKRAWREIKMDKIQTEFATGRTSWKFNPPLSPHFGGVWERLVQSVKKSLEFTLKSRIPKEEVLKTLLFEAANSVNSRPLTHVSIDKDDPEALTPNHFLLGTSGSAPTPGVFSDQDLFLRNQWRLSQRLSDIFWNRWVKEYLPTLTKRSKWNISAKPVQVSDVVIIADENNPRNLWPKGIIVATFPGKDGKIRVVEVKTCTGTYRRPVCKIIVLDVHQKESDDPQ